MIIIDIDETKKISKLARNILEHFKTYLESLGIKKDLTMVDEYVIGNNLRVDFAFVKTSPEVFIEVDGIQHSKVVEHWGGEEGLARRKVNDRNKEEILFVKYPDHYFIRFDHNYIDYEEFLKIIEPFELHEVFEKGDVKEDIKLDSKFYKPKSKMARKKKKKSF